MLGPVRHDEQAQRDRTQLGGDDCPAVSVVVDHETDQDDSVIARLRAHESASSSESLGVSAESLVLELRRAWSQWEALGPLPSVKTVGQCAKLVRYLRLCAARAHWEPLLAHELLVLTVTVLDGAWEGQVAPVGLASSEGGEAKTAEPLQPISLDCVAAAAQVVCALSALEAFTQHAATVPSLVGVLVRLLSCSAADGAQESGVRAIKNVATQASLADALVGAEAVPALVAACGPVGSVALREQAARALGNIATHEAHEDAVIDAEGVQALTHLLGLGTHMPVVDAALGGLGNLIESPRMREAFVNARGVQKLLALWGGEMAQAAPEAACTPSTAAALTEEEEESFTGSASPDTSFKAKHGSFKARFNELAWDETAWDDRLGALRLEEKEDEAGAEAPAAPSGCGERLRMQASWLLVSLAADPNTSWAVVCLGGVRAIVRYAQQGDVAGEEEGAWALANLSGDKSNAAAICEAGALPLLLTLAFSKHATVQLQTMWALANLAVADDAKRELHELGALPLLVESLRQLLSAQHGEAALPSDGTLSQLLRCISNLLVRPDGREALVACGGLKTVVAAAAAVTACADDLRTTSARLFANLSYDADLAVQAMDAGALPPLVSMLTSKSPQLEQEAAAAVLNLSAAAAAAAAAGGAAGAAGGAAGAVHAEALVACGVLEPLALLLHRNDNPLVQEQAALSLANIAYNESTKRRVVGLGVIEQLSRLRASAPNQKVQDACRRALEVLSEILTPQSRKAVSPGSRTAIGFARRGSPLVVVAG